ncbi:MAG: hypothetical protein DRI97_13160 [Bacteroidetes bacterium]|nr:MAG: hypothetical protein DRG83_04085 [Deltaproteobacteria bacterium]RLD53599.1 MAG: hypothetical protein DRI97_13160 [Bacteroidota bacterium]
MLNESPLIAFTIPGKVEAEDYIDMHGIQTETTINEGGGMNVGWIDPGDWLDYYVDVQITGRYKLDYRIASLFASGQIQLKSSDSTIATTNLPMEWERPNMEILFPVVFTFSVWLAKISHQTGKCC